MRDLAGRPGLIAMVPNEDLSAGSQGVFNATGIEQTAHDSAEYVPAVKQRQCLAHPANIFYHEALIFVRRLIARA